MNVARLYPARRQPDGTIWYRPAPDTPGAAGPGMGWTSNRDSAHPDYLAADAPEPIPHDDLSLVGHPDRIGARVLFMRNVGRTYDEIGYALGMDPDQAQALLTEVYPEIHRPPPVEVPPQQPEETPPPMTALTEDFQIAPRTTEWMGYPLPPAPPRATIKHGAWGWYQLPSPTTGRPTGYPRATTIADTLDDQFGLNKWKRRETAKRIYQLSQMDPGTKLNPLFDTTAGSALEQLVVAMDSPKVTTVDGVLDVIDNLLGGAEARELGECVHAWLEGLCLGTVLYRDVPVIVQPHIDAAFKVMAHRGIISRPEYIERVILNDQGTETVAGRIDCIWELVETGELVLGDWKTNKDLQYSWLSYGVQVGGVYGWATKMLTTDGKGWEPMPKIRQDYAILLHVPSNEPEKAAAITIDMQWGGEVMVESLATRARRKEAKHEVPKHALPSPSDRSLRIVKARLSLSRITSLDEGQAVYEAYEDVWNDSLGEFAATVAELM